MTVTLCQDIDSSIVIPLFKWSGAIAGVWVRAGSWGTTLLWGWRSNEADHLSVLVFIPGVIPVSNDEKYLGYMFVWKSSGIISSALLMIVLCREGVQVNTHERRTGISASFRSALLSELICFPTSESEELFHFYFCCNSPHHCLIMNLNIRTFSSVCCVLAEH